MKITVCAIFLFISAIVFGQSQNEKLAYQYFSGKQFEKAVILYADLHKKEALSKFYTPLLKSYLFLERFKDAEKLVKRHAKKNPERIDLGIDLGYVYEQWGKLKKAKKSYENTIDEMLPNTNVILNVGNGFYKRGKYEYAIKAYLKGKKLLDGDYPFAFELAKVYEAQGNITKVSQSLIGILDFGEAYLESVKNALSTFFTGNSNEKRKKVVQKELLSKIQRNPDNIGLSELLIWFYLQDKKFNSAFIHSKALDKRNDERGRRMMKLASICVQNKAYKVAVKSYQYLIDKGDNSNYYRTARLDLVKVLNLKLVEDPSSSIEDVEHLRKSYKDALGELGENAFTIDLMRGYAHMLAFNLGETTEAKEYLNKCIGLQRAKKTQRAKCKIELADIYVVENEVWEAVLLYGQVNQDFKDDEIGHSAKLKSAKAYYYTGEFEWAKAQLDVLKASTTKLISNDAMQLSILISDNLAIDTSTVPLKMYAQADLYSYQKNDSMALDYCDSILAKFPKNATLLDDVYFLKAKIKIRNKQWELAIANFQKAVDYQDLLKDDALFEMGMIYDKILKQPEKALSCFEAIILEHEDSIYSIEARKHFRRLRGDKI
jgi:tetratricopeptide (TPR) repeat protein